MPEKRIVKTITTCAVESLCGRRVEVKIFDDGSTHIDCPELCDDGKCWKRRGCIPKSPFSNSIDNVEKPYCLNCIFK